MPMLTGIWENFTDSEGMKTPKIDCLLKFQDKEVYRLGFQVCRPWKYRVLYHLNRSLDAVLVLIGTSSSSCCACFTKTHYYLPHLLLRTGETCYSPSGLATPCPWSTWLDCKCTPSHPRQHLSSPLSRLFMGTRVASPMICVWIPCPFPF